MFVSTNDHDSVFPRGNAQQGVYAKQILRLAVCQTALALGQAMDVNEPNTQPLEPAESFSFMSMLVLMFATACILFFAFCCMIPEPEPEDSDDSDEESEGEHARFTRYMFSSISEVSDPEEWQNMHHHSLDSDESSGEQGDQVPPASNTSGGQASSQPAVFDARIPLRPNMVKCYAMLSASFRRLKQVMMVDPRQQGRGFAVLSQLQQVYSSFEESRPNSNNYGLLHQMMASISQMEEVARVQVSSSLEIDDMDSLINEQDPELQPNAIMPTDDELDGALLFQGDMPAPNEPMSPESIAGWMVKRLSRRIYFAVLSGSESLKRYYVMREIMRGTVLVCNKSELDRRRALSMLHDIRDLSDHSSSNDSQRDPMEDFTNDIPDDDAIDTHDSFQGDFYDFQERVYGPIDDVRGVPLRPATIPAYVIVNGQPVYTLEQNELPDEATASIVSGSF